jgi:hypothetical protein
MTKKRKALPSNDEDTTVVSCWYGPLYGRSDYRFCEREFADKMVLTAHQKAKHFTCHVCSKKLNSVNGMPRTLLSLIGGLQNHLKTMHRESLETIPNALSHRSNPATVPDLSAMESTPTNDAKPRIQLSSTPQSGPPQKQLKFQKFDQTVKKAKVDAPLATETIQAQLAEFQKKKEEQEVQDLIKQGIVFPPGLTPHQALQIFEFRNPPPGTGPFAAKSAVQLMPLVQSGPIPPAPSISNNPPKTLSDGKSNTLAFPPQSSSSYHSASSPKFVSKSGFSNGKG